jgi:hypothetical protein
VPTIHVEVPHALGAAAARQCMKQLLNELQSSFPGQAPQLREDENGTTTEFQVQAAGMDISGTIETEDKRVLLQAQLPLRAALFKGKIESILREHITKALAAGT